MVAKKPTKKLSALSINEALGDVATHFMKSGSSFRPKGQLDELSELREIVPNQYRNSDVQYDLWFNTNEIRTVRKWLYTDFLGRGIYFRVPSLPINDKLLRYIANDNSMKIDEERIEKIINCLENKYSLQWNTEFYDKVVFPPGTNLLSNPNCINWRRFDQYMKDGYVVKPHPITAHLFIAKFRLRYGEENVLNKKEGGFELLMNCKQMACGQNSEMGIMALLKGKKIGLITKPVSQRQKALGTYESIYGAITGGDCIKKLYRILSAKNSGIIFNFDEDREERLQAYFDNFWDYKVING